MLATDLAVVVKQQQEFLVIFVARLTIDRDLAAVLVSVWTLVPVLVRCRFSLRLRNRGCVYATDLLRLCWICWNSHSPPVAYQEFLSILGLDHKAAPLVVGSRIDWYDAAKRTRSCVPSRCLKFRVAVTTASSASAEPIDEFGEPIFHGFSFLDQTETTLWTRETVS
jgi:hypothetical protein